MSVIGGQNTPSLNGLAYIIDFNNNYTSGSSTVNPVLYFPTSSQFTGSVPNLINGQVQFTGSSVLRSFQNFPGFNPNTGNLTIMFSGEVKNNAVLFTQDGQIAVVATTSSIGYGVPAGNVGRNFPNVGFDHVTLRFSSASVDCFVNGIPVSASGIFPTVPSSSVFTDFKIGGNYLTSWTGSLSGSLGQLMVYNRPLSDDEIYSNYLIQARRYGLSEAPKPYTVDSSVYVYSQAAGITDTVTLNALNTFVQGLKSASLWDKMVAIYPFIGVNSSGSRLNLKDVSLNTTQVNYSGSWSTSLSGSRNNNTASYGILSNVRGTYVHPLINSQSIHLSYLSYDTPASGGYLMGVEQIPGLPGDIAQPAAAYSVRKVRTAYTGSAMTVRRDFDDVTFDVGFDASGNLNTGSLLTNMTASGIVTTLPGDYSGLAAAYSLRKVVSTYTGSAIEVQSGSVSQSIGFDSLGNLNTGSLLTFAGSGNAFVKTWYDQSGNGNHATQSVDASQPQIVSNGVIITENGKPSLQFDGTDDTFSIVNRPFTGATAFSIFSTANFKGVNTYEMLFNQSDGIVANNRLEIRRNASTNFIEYLANTVSSNQGTINVSNKQILSSYIGNSPQINAYVNNVLDISYNGLSFNIVSNPASIGSRNGNFYFGGIIQEMILYTSDQSTNRGLIEDNINGYYSIFTQSLASGSGYVTRWYDQSGNNNHATQSVAANQPLILSSGSLILTSGKSALSFDQTNDFFITPTLPLTQPALAFATYFNTGSALQRIFVSSNDRFNFDIFSDLGIYAGTQLIGSRTLGYALASLYFSGSTSQVYENSVLKATGNAGTGTTSAQLIIGKPTIDTQFLGGTLQEIIIYSGSQASNRQPIEQNINSYFNIYTPLAYNLNTNSLSLFSSPTTVAGAANAVASGLTTGGPIGLITVSRTGSSNYTLWKNKVPTKTTSSPSTASSFEVYLNAANLNNTLFSSSQNNIAYASVGAGLTDSETSTYYDLINTFQTSLGRGVSNPNAFITTWDTRITGTGTISNTSSIVLPLNGTQAITASWGDGTVSLISSSAQVDRTHSYATPGIYTVTITGQGQGFQFNNGGDRNKLMDIGQWGSISGSTSAVFRGCTNLVGTAPDRHVLQTTSLGSYFSDCTNFKGAIGNWNTSAVTGMGSMFQNARSFNQPIGLWNVSQVIDMSYMFWLASSFNQNIGSWDVRNVTSMDAMFIVSTAFNNGGSSDINNWNTSAVTLMSDMFRGTAFNQPIGSWNVSSVTNMLRMFYDATSFNNSGSNSINNWRPISCSNFSAMFQNATSFNQPIGNWPISASNINMSSMFNNADAFNQNIGSWDVSKVTNMSSMFQNNGGFNNSGSSDINNWRPISCSNFSGMFSSATAFNQPIGNWPLSASNINMTSMFESATSFNQNIGSWNVGLVTNMSRMFYQATSFNQNIGGWNVSSVRNMNSMFEVAHAFNQNIGSWNVGLVTNMSNMFNVATTFNQNIGSWNVGLVTDMSDMFRNAPAFNNGGSSDINNWTTSAVTNMSNMFNGAGAFNQNIGSWNTSAVTTMSSMFSSATAFNQDIGSWNVSNVTNFTNFMANKTTYSFLHTIYDGWINNKLRPNLSISFNTIKYSGSAAEGRALLTRTYNTASITGYSNDGGQMAITCSANHNVIVGNKVFISGSSYSTLNGVQTVLVAGSPTTLTFSVPYDPTATGGDIITGYGWSITDGGVV